MRKEAFSAGPPGPPLAFARSLRRSWASHLRFLCLSQGLNLFGPSSGKPWRLRIHGGSWAMTPLAQSSV